MGEVKFLDLRKTPSRRSVRVEDQGALERDNSLLYSNYLHVAQGEKGGGCRRRDCLRVAHQQDVATTDRRESAHENRVSDLPSVCTLPGLGRVHRGVNRSPFKREGTGSNEVLKPQLA